jgi:ArsR family transcriptional regulator, arsenate/arsenite/antimonite-responsive transcriptional repressor
MEEYLRPLKALSDETRLRMLNILTDRECCVCEVMQALDISQTRASRNLKILEESGFLKSRREGTWIHYSLSEGPPRNFAAALAKITGEYTKKNPVLKKDLEQLKKAKQIGICCGSNGKNCRKQ